MLDSLLKLTDRISWFAARLADISVLALVGAMVYEVVARYVFNAPTEWSYDIAYMGSGSLFILGVSWTLRENAHIRIDVVRKLLPKRVGDLIESLIYLLLLAPLFFYAGSHRPAKNHQSLGHG
ncbi:MAG: TRAP transporter small permease subunit [Burkholderiaceae bacterium]|nr:TRAP transporter small permease subunit [Burkholderiaceae bacterium]